MFILLQYILPQKWLTRLVGWLARGEWGGLSHWFIKRFVNAYQVNLAEAALTEPCDYPSFNAFFTRALKPGAREIDVTARVVAPADGAVSAFGPIREGQVFQAKGQDYSLQALLGGSTALSAPFMRGCFITEYLSPKDYHRVHMPIAGKLLDMVYVPGKLFSVNTKAVAGIPGVFARNERVVCFFETALGKMALVMVGAMIVGNIEMVFHGQVNPKHTDTAEIWHYQHRDLQFECGQELGRFNMGSTVILVFERDWPFVADLQPHRPLVLGEALIAS